MFYRLVVPLHIAFKWISKFSIQILHHRQMFDRLATSCQEHPTTIFGKYLFARRFEI